VVIDDDLLKDVISTSEALVERLHLVLWTSQRGAVDRRRQNDH